jgi:hypothetical protein
VRRIVFVTGLVLLATGILLPLTVEAHKLVWNFTHQAEIVARWGQAPLVWLANNPFFAYASPDGFAWYITGVYVGVVLAAIGAGLCLAGEPKEWHERRAD